MVKIVESNRLDKNTEKLAYKIADKIFQKFDKKLSYKEYPECLRNNYHIPEDIIDNILDVSYKFYLEMWYMSDMSNWVDFDDWVSGKASEFTTRLNNGELEIIR